MQAIKELLFFFFIFLNGIFCLVIIRNIAINRAAKIARYKASSPDDTEMFRTKGPNVPNIIIDATSIKRGLFSCFI